MNIDEIRAIYEEEFSKEDTNPVKRAPRVDYVHPRIIKIIEDPSYATPSPEVIASIRSIIDGL